MIREKLTRSLTTLFLALGLTLVPGADPAPSTLYTFDARPLRQLDVRQPANAVQVWDTLHLLAALQGLANRQAPQFYLFYCNEFGIDTDQFWFDWLRQEDGWLKSSSVTPLPNVEACLRTFRTNFLGLVVYDSRVPATANLASTAAGCEDLLPVRYDPQPGSWYDLLVRQRRWPVRLWLVNPDGSPKFKGSGLIPDSSMPSTGSAKADAYLWALARYVKTGFCNPRFAGYYLDAFWLQQPTRGAADLHTLSNHDYFIARKAFFFDLSPWGDEKPNDDPYQPLGLDRRVFLEVLRSLHNSARGDLIKVGGFPPWPFKYTSHASAGKHEGVATEWEFSRLISQFNGYMEADAASLSALANASFYQHYPLRNRYPQPNAKRTPADWKARGYLMANGRLANRLFVGHYVGDYDSPSWLYKAVPAFFRDPARGKIPLSWAFNPNLSDRVPQVLAYAYKQATTNDFFIAGDSGAGYLNPRGLTLRPESQLPSGLAKWQLHCQKHYGQWDMTISGFVLDGSAGASTDVEFAAYRTFSPDGLGTHFERGPSLHLGIPTCPEQDLPDNVVAAADFIASQAAQANTGPAFLWARSILKSPQWYVDLSEQLRLKHPQARIEVVDPYTFFGLIKLHLSGPTPKN